MDEADIIRDVLERIDKLTQHIIDIKATMYRQADFKMDAARMYDHIGSIHTQLANAIKEAISAIESQITAIKADVAAHHVKIEKAGRHLPPWAVMVFTAIGTLAAEQLFLVAEHALNISPAAIH